MQRSVVLPPREDPAVVSRIQSTVAAALSDRARLLAAWRDTFALPCWYFPVRGDADGRAGLCVSTVRGRPHLAAFTTVRRLRAFTIDVLGVAGEVPAVALTPREFLDGADEHAARGVHGIAFDHGHTGHYTALGDLKPLWARCFGVPFESGNVPVLEA